MPRPALAKTGEEPHRRQDILDAAKRLFAEQGYQETSMRQIAQAVGIQQSSLYHHFAMKEDMLHAIVDDTIMQMPGRYAEIIRTGEGPRETLRAMIEFGFRETLRNAQVLAIIIHERKMLSANPRFSYVEETLREIERIWFGLLQDGMRQGVFRPGLNYHLVLRLMFDMAGSAVAWYRPNSRRYSLEDVIATQVELIFNGIC
jgi:AcrR family transcriptional regulator